MNESHEQPKKRRRLRKFAFRFLLLLLLYVLSYALLSFSGGWMVTESGRWRPFGTVAEIDCIQWQPRLGFCQRFTWSGGHEGIRADFLGYFYAPLILLDQSHIHPTIPLFRTLGDPDNGIDTSRIPPLSEWHPTRVNQFAGRFPYVSEAPKSK